VPSSLPHSLDVATNVMALIVYHDRRIQQMAQIQITQPRYAKYDDHHFHAYQVGEIYTINPFGFMTLPLSVLAIAQGWAVSTGSAATPADDLPEYASQHAQVGAKQKLING